LKYVLPHPGSSHLYVRRWDVGDHTVETSLSVESVLADDDAVVDGSDCFVTGGGAGAMGHSRLEVCDAGGDGVVGQLTTMIAAGAEDNGTNIPLTLVRTTGRETGFEAGVSPATAVSATVAGCRDSEQEDEDLSDKSSSLAVDMMGCVETGDLTAACCVALVFPGICGENLGNFSGGLGATGAGVELAASRERLRGTLAAADTELASLFIECRLFTLIVVMMLDEAPRGKLVDGAVLAGTTGGAQRRETDTAYPRGLGEVGGRPFTPLHRRSNGSMSGAKFFFASTLFPLGNSDSSS